MISLSENKKLLEIYYVLSQAIELYLNVDENNARQILSAQVQKIILTIIKYIKELGIVEEKIYAYLKEIDKMIVENGKDEEIKELLYMINIEIEKIDVGEAIYENLYMEDNVLKYFDILEQAYENNLTILISSYGTSCSGNNFTKQMGIKLQKLGLKENLSNLINCSYIAVVSDQKVIDEQISSTNAIEKTYMLDETEIYMRSVGANVKKRAIGASLRINGIEYRAGYLGLNIVVYDRKKDQLVDSICFPVDKINKRVEHLQSNREKQFIAKNPDVTFFRIDKPEFSKEPFTVYEEFILTSHVNIERLAYYSFLAYPILQHIPDLDGVKEVLTQPDIYRGVDGSRKFFDKRGKYLNCVNGHRVTECQPKNYIRTIYILGGCIELGVGVKDADTVASLLQNMLNEKNGAEGFRVVNLGMGCTGVCRTDELLNTIESINLRAGDIVIGLGEKIRPYSKEYDIRPCKYGEVHFDTVHLAKGGMTLFADEIYNALLDNNFFVNENILEKAGKDENKIKQIDRKNNVEYQKIACSQELIEYKRELESLWETQLCRSDNVGAIVMNCNPFTLGHRYLIEQASKKCEYLIIFVVQEDKSEFLFKDRIELVRQGTKDLSNVIIRPSGQFIISMETFKGYFNKRELQDRKVDSTKDVLIFANEIAPAAHIKKRFVGSEPFDKVTETYNRNMESILPEYGVEFIEIPRIKGGSETPISASRVRELLKEGNFAEIEKLVPKTTYDYLFENFN